MGQNNKLISLIFTLLCAPIALVGYILNRYEVYLLSGLILIAGIGLFILDYYLDKPRKKS